MSYRYYCSSCKQPCIIETVTICDMCGMSTREGKKFSSDGNFHSESGVVMMLCDDCFSKVTANFVYGDKNHEPISR